MRRCSERVRAAPLPSAEEPPWLRQRGMQALVAPAAAHLLTGAAAALPAASRTALLHAATSALDAAIPRALRDPHAGALPAANERVERVLRTYGCPPPVVHAAMRARAVLEQPVASETAAGAGPS